jgi:hypothetical protein
MGVVPFGGGKSSPQATPISAAHPNASVSTVRTFNHFF